MTFREKLNNNFGLNIEYRLEHYGVKFHEIILHHPPPCSESEMETLLCGLVGVIAQWPGLNNVQGSLAVINS